MKKVLVAVIAFMVLSSLCFAQESKQPTPVQEMQKVASATATLIGKIVSITVADPAKGVTKGAMVIVDDLGQTTKVTVDSAVTITDNTLNAVTLNQINKDQTVKVDYKTTEAGDKEATTVNVVK